MSPTQGKTAVNKNCIWGRLDIRDTKKKKKLKVNWWISHYKYVQWTEGNHVWRTTEKNENYVSHQIGNINRQKLSKMNQIETLELKSTNNWNRNIH